MKFEKVVIGKGGTGSCFINDENREYSIPMALNNAIIGLKCPEQGSNVDLFNYMNRQMGTMPDSWLKPAVRASKIEDYR